jgi:hypothetical protein
MTSGAMQTTRNFIIPYFIYLLFIYLSPTPFQAWLRTFFPALEFDVVDLKKVILPLVAVVITHYLLFEWRRKSNILFFNRVNEPILDRIKNEMGAEFDSWPRVRHAFYHVIDNDNSLTYLSDRIKHNGLVWFGFADLRLASVLTFVAWALGGSVAYLLNAADFLEWFQSALLSMAMLIVSAVGSELSTRRHLQLIDEQLNQMFPLHKEALRQALTTGRP